MSTNVTNKGKVIFLLCGSFNPITILHLRMFELAKDHFRLLDKYDVVGGIISPVHDSYSKKGLISSKHRIEMLNIAIANNLELICDDWETLQPNWTPTKIALESLTRRLKNDLYDKYTNTFSSSNAKKRKVAKTRSSAKWIENMNINEKYCIKLICGADLLESFATVGLWDDKDIEYILHNHGLVVISRDGSDAKKFIVENNIVSKYKENIDIIINGMGSDISSTKVRRAISRSESVKYIIPDSVLLYIKQNDLYSDSLTNDI